MKFFLAIFLLLTIFPSAIKALEKGKWSIIKEDEYCFIGSLPVETDLPEEKKRGDNYIIVYKYIGNPETIIQIEAGFNYDLNQDINVKIDNTNFIFYTTEDVSDAAWTNEDTKVIFAMKKGLELTISAKSSRGTLINDKYSLRGFTAELNKLNKDC